MDQFRLVLVDGFAGGGMYRDQFTHEDRFGSPLLMLRAMHDAEEAAKQRRTKEFKLDVRYYFIEKQVEAFKHLEKTLHDSAFRSAVAESATLINDSFVHQAERIVQEIKKRSKKSRAIFVLDQFGYTDVPIRQIQSILCELENAEVILTFATDSLIDYLSTTESTQKILTNLGIQLSTNDIMTAKQHSDWRWAIQRLLHKEIHEKTGAKFYTPFFIRSPDAHRDFWLIHLSGHSRARDVMVGLHWTENTSFSHYGRSGLNMLGYDPKEDSRLNRQLPLPGFFFDGTARSATHQALVEELPERIHPFRRSGGIPFDVLFSKLTNESPATSDIFRAAIEDLAIEGAIEVRDRTGTTKRKRGVQHPSDIINPARQRQFFRR